MMRSTKQLSVTLPNEMAAQVRARVASGEYASESEVIRDGLRALQARDRAVEGWLRNEALPAYDAYKADPQRGLSLEEVKTGLAARHGRTAGRD
jgi:putative addiction module CopG family antidote